MEQSSFCEANRYSASQEIPRTYKRPPPVPILNQRNPVHASSSHFLTIHFNIIPPSTHDSPNGLFQFDLPNKTLYTSVLSPIRATCPPKLILVHRIVSGE